MILLMEEILHQVVDSLSHYLQGYTSQVVSRISEPSTVFNEIDIDTRVLCLNSLDLDLCLPRPTSQRRGRQTWSEHCWEHWKADSVSIERHMIHAECIVLFYYFQ